MKFSQFLITLVVGSLLLFPFAQMYEKAQRKQEAILQVRFIINDYSSTWRDYHIYTHEKLSLRDIEYLRLKFNMRLPFKHEPPSFPIEQIKEIEFFWEAIEIILLEDHDVKITRPYTDNPTERMESFIGLVKTKAEIEVSTAVRDFLREKFLREKLREKEKKVEPSNNLNNLKLPMMIKV